MHEMLKFFIASLVCLYVHIAMAWKWLSQVVCHVRNAPNKPRKKRDYAQEKASFPPAMCSVTLHFYFGCGRLEDFIMDNSQLKSGITGFSVVQRSIKVQPGSLLDCKGELLNWESQLVIFCWFAATGEIYIPSETNTKFVIINISQTLVKCVFHAHLSKRQIKLLGNCLGRQSVQPLSDYLFCSSLGCVLPLQEVALHQSLFSGGVLAYHRCAG